MTSVDLAKVAKLDELATDMKRKGKGNVNIKGFNRIANNRLMDIGVKSEQQKQVIISDALKRFVK